MRFCVNDAKKKTIQYDIEIKSFSTFNKAHDRLNYLNRDDMIKMINCTLDGFEWITDGAHPPLTRCHNQTEGHAALLNASLSNAIEK